jgi:SAM-dependent methyltransferase
MENFIYNIRWQVDDKEWRARSRRELAFSLWHKYGLSCKKPKTLLDIGCGTGVLLKAFSTISDVYGLDLSSVAVNYCRKRGLNRTVIADAKYPCFRKNAFDLITMIEVLEHVEDDERALISLRQILKPRGLLILTVPAFQFLWSDRDVKLHHKRRYTKRNLSDKIKLAGLNLVFCNYIDIFLFLPLWCIASANRIFANSVKFQTYEVSFPGLINNLMLNICRMERKIYTRFNFPIGVSLACVAQRS